MQLTPSAELFHFDKSQISLTPLSLQDPAGKVFEIEGNIFRAVYGSFLNQLRTTFQSPVINQFIEQGRFIDSWPVSLIKSKEIRGHLESHQIFFSPDTQFFEHPRLPFVSYPQEWPAEALYDAALLTLDLAEGLLSEGLGLKDASAYNLVPKGSTLVFVDVLSVETRAKNDAIWLPYSQFSRHFINPLLLQNFFGIPTGTKFLGDREGVLPEEIYDMCGPLQRLYPTFFSSVTLPVWLSRKLRFNNVTLSTLCASDRARFILEILFKRFRKQIKKSVPSQNGRSRWLEYMGKDLPYSQNEILTKKEAVTSILKRFHPKKVLDMGCNTGVFSCLAAEHGASVVAIDSDPIVIGNVWNTAKERGLAIHPLVINLANPTAAAGWLNKQSSSFIERAKGNFNLVLMLALLHHLIASDGIPLSEILKLSSLLTTDHFLIEFISPNDWMFSSLARGRDFSWLTKDFFEREVEKFFSIGSILPMSHETRQLYHLRKK